MKLRRPMDWFSDKRTVDVRAAVEDVCTYSDHRDSVSRVVYNHEAMAELLGRLVEQLHRTGVLSDFAVLEVIGDPFEKVE